MLQSKTTPIINQVHQLPKSRLLGDTEANFTLLHVDCSQENIQVEITDLGFLIKVYTINLILVQLQPNSSSLIILEYEGQKHSFISKVSLRAPRQVPQKLLAASIWVILEGPLMEFFSIFLHFINMTG